MRQKRGRSFRRGRRTRFLAPFTFSTHPPAAVLTDLPQELQHRRIEAIGRLHDFQAHAAGQPLRFSIGAGDSLLHWLVLPRLAALRTQVNFRLLNLRTSEIIATYVYKVGLLGGSFSFSTAVGFFNSVVNCLLLIAFNGVARRIGQASLW